jgi:hypothetical protein
VVERFDFLLAFLNFLSELVGSVEVLADIGVLCEFLDLLQLFLKLNQLSIEDLLLVLQLFRELGLSFLDDPLRLTDSLLDGLWPFLETPEADEGVIINLIEVLFQDEEVVGNSVNFILQFLHSGIVFTD